MSEKKFTQQLEVAGSELVDRVKELAKDADAKRVVIRDQEGKELLAFPLSWGVAGGAVAVFAAPILAAVAAVGALAANVKLEVERSGEPGPEDDVLQDDAPGAGTVQGQATWTDEVPPPLPGQHP